MWQPCVTVADPREPKLSPVWEREQQLVGPVQLCISLCVSWGQVTVWALAKWLGSRPGPQLRLKGILVEILRRSLFWWEPREKSSLPLISSAFHLAFLSSFLSLLCHGYSYRYHRDEGLLLTAVPKAGKEDWPSNRDAVLEKQQHNPSNT